jgi:hypothetical protein
MIHKIISTEYLQNLITVLTGRRIRNTQQTLSNIQVTGPHVPKYTSGSRQESANTGNVKGPKHSKLNYAVYLCKKPARKTELNALYHSTYFQQVCRVFFVSSVCLLVRVAMVDRNMTVGFLSELCSSLCERQLESWSSKACAIACQNCAV